MFNLPAISGDWSLEKMSNIKKNQALLWDSNGQSELSLLDSLAFGFYSDAEFFFTIVSLSMPYIYLLFAVFMHAKWKIWNGSVMWTK